MHLWLGGRMLRYLLFFLWIFWLPLSASAAPERVESTVSARVIRDYARITFEWPRPVYLTATANGTTLIIDFERPVEADMKTVMSRLGPYVKNATSENGGRRLRLQMTAPYPVRSFVSDQISGVDLLNVKTTAKTVAKKTPAPVDAVRSAPLAALTPSAGVAAPPPSTEAASAPITDAEAFATMQRPPETETAPVIPENGAAPMTDAEAFAARKSIEKKSAAPLPPSSPETIAPAAAPTPSPAATPPVTTPAATPLATTEPPVESVAGTPPATPETAAPLVKIVEDKALRVGADINGDLVNITFPWQERVAAAGFTRNGRLWLLFNRETTLSLTDANVIIHPGVVMEQMPVEGATLVVFKTRPDTGMVFQLVEGTFGWQVTLSSLANKPETAMEVSTSTEPGLPPHVLISALETPETPLRIVDPLVGDALLVMPMYTVGRGMLPERSFVDFKLLETWQGIVTQVIADDTTMVTTRNGVRVATERGAHISTDLPPVEAGAHVQAKMDEDTVLFPNDEWTVAEGKDPQAEIDRLVRSVARDRAAVGAVSKYHRAAQIYLSEGQAVEAIGMVQMAKRLDPEYYVDKRLSAMEGAANFLLQRYSEAFTLFNRQELEVSKEAIFWRSMLGEILGSPNQSFNFEEHYTHYIRRYPPLMRQRLAILAADRAIGAKDYNTALKIFDQLNKEQVIEEVADYVNYLMGTISVANKQEAEGFKIWEKLLDHDGREFVKTRAEFALIAQRYAKGELTDEATIDMLERIGLRWRGDVLELNVLKLLSSLYQKHRDWPNALRVWKTLNDGFPNTVEAVEASRNMDDAFRAIFDQGETGQLTTLEQLFLFHEYRDLLTDDETGDRISEKLVQKMLALDLMDEATDLLEKRMRNRFERDVRSNVGAQLARLYLQHQKPLKALYALQDSVYGQNPEALTHERTMLSVRAMIGMRRFEDALDLLVNNKTKDGETLRGEVYWQTKDWEQMIPVFETVIKMRGSPATPVSNEEAEVLLKLALGYLATEEATQLAYLRDYFTPLMQGHPRADVFEYLTRTDIPVTPDTFEEAMHQIQQTRIFLKKAWQKS